LLWKQNIVVMVLTHDSLHGFSLFYDHVKKTNN
jgi:hypothetical protein